MLSTVSQTCSWTTSRNALKLLLEMLLQDFSKASWLASKKESKLLLKCSRRSLKKALEMLLSMLLNCFRTYPWKSPQKPLEVLPKMLLNWSWNSREGIFKKTLDMLLNMLLNNSWNCSWKSLQQPLELLYIKCMCGLTICYIDFWTNLTLDLLLD